MKIVNRVLAVALLLPAALSAQQTEAPKDTVKKDTVKKAPATVTLPPIALSGTIYGNYQYRGEKGANHSQNKFDLERVYLTFRGSLSDRTSFRVTTDVFQQTTSPNDAYYKGWTVRMKYAYLQYDYLKSPTFNASIRGGMIQNSVIEYEEAFWPRWIAKVGVDNNKYFSSSDVGVSTLISLPNKLGEAYVGAVNGNGYDNRETDRFKDYQFRLALTPLAQTATPFFKGLAIMPWYYRGSNASSIAGVGNALAKDRYGVFVGIKDPRATFGFDYANRKDETDAGTPTARTVTGIDGRLISTFGVIRPFQIVDASSHIPLGIIARWDQFKPNTNVSGVVRTTIAGLTWDLSSKAAISLDYQEATPHNGLAVAPTKTYFLHWVANF